MGKMVIVSRKEGFEWRPIKLDPKLLSKHAIAYNSENWAPQETYQLLFLKQAQQELHEFIGWGNMHYMKNRVEQIGFLAGRHYEDKEAGMRYCVVAHVLPIYEAKGSPAYIEYTTDMLVSAISRLDVMNLDETDPCEIIGWFHTHPNGLPTFMSGTDMITQHSTFNKEYNFSVVLNPHSKSWKAFRGYNADASQSYWLNVDDILNLGSVPEVEALNPVPVVERKITLRLSHKEEPQKPVTAQPATVQPVTPQPVTTQPVAVVSERRKADEKNISARRKARQKNKHKKHGKKSGKKA